MGLYVALLLCDIIFRFWSTPVGIVAVPSLNALSHLPLAEEIRARFQATICGICGGQE